MTRSHAPRETGVGNRGRWDWEGDCALVQLAEYLRRDNGPDVLREEKDFGCGSNREIDHLCISLY
ncbi:hypothetical protein CC80DRAFT_495902 [Byssothecium circinans]|uniref:Uncharacterized protein n=1 Tax=Byssothecium circinans TaxID=147558 RepID=A0A6A5TG05_9PLEO|nr:hypothetical protein CC80DRAFT_495902 [Byssothecium circinans]